MTSELIERLARAFRAEEKLNWNLELGNDDDVADLARIAIAAMQANTAEQAAELAKWQALAETLAGALGEAVTWNSHDDEGVPAVWLDQADVALREYKGKTHVAVAQYKEARDV